MEQSKQVLDIKLQAVNSLDTDFRAEVITCNLIAAGQDPAKSLIVRHRGDKRNVSKDVHKMEHEYSSYDLMEYLYIYTNRESIYDALPEGIFHQGHSAKKQKTQEDIIAEIRGHRHEEFLARRYFRPFEMAMDSLLVDIQQYEQQFDKAHLYRNVSTVFADHWNILKYLSLRQALLFIKVVPIIAEASQDVQLIEKIISIILECPVSIRQSKKSTREAVPLDRAPLGTWRLGINSVLGKCTQNTDVDLNITIGPVSPEQMRLFESGKNNQLILSELVDFLIPFDHNTSIHYKIDNTGTRFRLSNKEYKSYLGINTTL